MCVEVIVCNCLKLEKEQLKFKGSKLWNNLPTDIKITKSPPSFEHKLINPFITVSGLIGTIEVFLA